MDNLIKTTGGKPNSYFVSVYPEFTDSWYDKVGEITNFNNIIVVGVTTGDIGQITSNSSNKSKASIESWNGSVATLILQHGSGSSAWNKKTITIDFDFSHAIGTDLVTDYYKTKIRVLGYVYYPQ